MPAKAEIRPILYRQFLPLCAYVVYQTYICAKLQRMEDNFMDENMQPVSAATNRIGSLSFGLQLLILVSLFAFCFLFAQMLSGVLIVAYYQTIDMKVIASNVYDLNTLRYSQMLASLCSFLVPALIFSKLKNTSILKFSNANHGFPMLFVVLVPILIYTIYPSINLVFYINKWMGFNAISASAQADYKMLVDALLKDKSISVLILNLITIALIPALAEEWIFRGTFQQLLSEKLNIHIAVLLASILFSLIHFEFSGFLPRIMLGMFLGYLFYYSSSLWISIFAHAINNGAQVILVYLNNVGIYKIDINQPELPKAWEFIVYSLLFIILWAVFYHFSHKGKNSTFAK